MHCLSFAHRAAAGAPKIAPSDVVSALLLALPLLAALGCASTRPSVRVSPARTAAEAGLVDIRTLEPGIAHDIRYATASNFTGTPIDGYQAPRCYLLRPAAEALQRVELELRRQHLRLKLFDCYRPVRAVRHFVRWAENLDDQHTKPVYYPNLDKRDLLGDYIAPLSGHSRGATVDLTLLHCAPSGAQCQVLDMGTDFDLFDPIANTDSPQVTAAQRGNRHRLRAAMSRHGFRNYPMEWWHYTLAEEPSPRLAYDVPVR